MLIFLFGKTDLKGLFEVVRHSDGLKMAFAFLIFLFLNGLVLVRWHLLLKGLNFDVGIGRVCLSYLSSLFFNLVLPSTIGGDTVRTLDISNHTKSHSSAILATVILDRVSGFLGLMTVLIISLLFNFRLLGDRTILLATVILCGLVLFVIGVMFSRRFFDFLFVHLPFKKIKEYFYKIHDATSSYRNKGGILWGAWFFSVVIQGGLSVVYFGVAQAIDLHLNFIYFLIFVPVITAFSVLPISIGGLGLRDTASVYLFSKIGVIPEKAFALSLTNFGFMFILGLLGGLSYVFTLHRRRV